MRGDRSLVAAELEKAARALEVAVAQLRSVPRTIDADDWLELRARIGKETGHLRRGANRVSRMLDVASAQAGILRFLQNHVGEIVDMDQLSGVAGIHEWARRVRELRVEHGWRIASGVTRDDLKPGHYVLEALEPDEDLAHDWRLAKGTRNLRVAGKAVAAKQRLLSYLTAIQPRAADKEQLAYVAKINEWPRRIRELVEEGWQIVGVYDDPTLTPGSYRLESLDRRPARQRESIKLRHGILERDRFTCADCGRSSRRERVQLQVHHIVLVSEGGTNEPANLVTLCSDCHAGRHSLHRGATRDELLEPGAEPTTTNR